MTKGFGIIGCGMIADFHARAIADIDQAKLVACYNRTAPKAEQLAAKHGGGLYRPGGDVGPPGLDVVTICSPSGVHMEPCLAAAAAGKHVIVEKPLDVTLERCDRMIEACERAGVKLATIFHHAFIAPAN